MSLAHFAVGNSTEYMLGMNTLAKLNQEQSIADALANLNATQALMLQRLTGVDLSSEDETL